MMQLFSIRRIFGGMFFMLCVIGLCAQDRLLRYWNIGPQQTLYLPVEWMKKGNYEIIIFEMLKPEMNRIHTIVKPILDYLK